jgi:hypothetical protein
MNNPNSSSNPTSSRATLKLKVGARKSASESKSVFPVRPDRSGSCPRPATASQAREPDSPSRISGAAPSPPLSHPCAKSEKAQPQNKAKLKPGAHWSDEYKERMQADMDSLLR